MLDEIPLEMTENDVRYHLSPSEPDYPLIQVACS